MAVDTRAELGIPAPAGDDRARMDDLVTAACDLAPSDRPRAIAGGIFTFGPHFLYALEERVRADPKNADAYRDAWGLFGSWLGGLQLTDDRHEVEQRARAAAELGLRGREEARGLDRLAAQCLLALQGGHPLRDEALAESLLRRALDTARRANDVGEVMRCGLSLLPFLSLAESIQLIDEGLAALSPPAGGRRWFSGRTSAPLPPEDEAFWRFRAATHLSHQAMRLGGSADPAEQATAAELAAKSIAVYQPTVQDAVRTNAPDPTVFWNWGLLLMNAGHWREAVKSFAHVRTLAPAGSEMWWHACFEEGMVCVDMHDWSNGSERLATLAPSLLANYAAFACHGFDEPPPSGMSHLRDDRLSSAHREVSEGFHALALCEAAEGRLDDAFVHVETAKAMDFRQRAVLHELTEPEIEAAPPVETLGHTRWQHGVPPPGTTGRDAQRATLLAERLVAPSIEAVAAALRPDEAVFSLGISQGTWGVGLRSGSPANETVSFVREDLSTLAWIQLLARSAGDDRRGSVLRPLDIDALDATLNELLPAVDEMIGAHIGKVAENGTRVLTLISDGWLQVFPVWALPSLDRDDLCVSVAANVNMVLSAPDIREVAREVSVIVDPTANLPVSFAELAAIRDGLGDGFGITALRRTEATPDAVSGAFSAPGIVHFTGHAVGDTMRPSDSALLVSGGSPGSVAPLRAADLEDAIPSGRGCGLAVLSACETGRGGIRLDSVVDHSGIAAGLQAGGVSAVVATLWPVSETAAALFVQLLYEELGSQEVADLPVLVKRSARRLRELTGAAASERLLELRGNVDGGRCRIRLEAYGRGLARRGSECPFAGPAAWASFYHVGARFLRFRDAR
jgi:CHAT domain